MLDRNLLSVASHVEAALAAKKPVVALESAVIFRYEDEITTPLLPGFKCSVARIFR